MSAARSAAPTTGSSVTSGTARLAGRVVLVTLPEYEGSTVLPPEGFQDALMARWVTLKEVEGPLINGTIALTWEDDPSPDGDLVAHSASIINDLLELPASTAPEHDGLIERLEGWREQRMEQCQTRVERTWVGSTIREAIEVVAGYGREQR